MAPFFFMETLDKRPQARPPRREKFMRNKRTLDIDILESIASEALGDGVLCLTMERLCHALQVDRSTVRSLIATGDLPSFGVGEHRVNRFVRIPAEAVLEFVRSRTPAIRTEPLRPPA